MKAVIVEIRGGFAVALSDDGCIVKVKNEDYRMGQVIEMKETVKKRIRFASTVAAAAAVAIVCGVGAYAYYIPYSYVSLDVNPSIEYSLNRLDRVLKITGINDDGKEIVRELQLDSLSNKKIDEAIALTVEQIQEDGFFDGDLEGGIVISTSAKDLKRAEKLAEDLKQSAADAAADKNVEVEAFPVGLERVQEARELGVTPGKLNLVEKLRDSAEATDDIDLEEWLDKPVKEIMQEIKENRKEVKLEAQSSKKDESSSQDTSSTDSSSSDDTISKPGKTEQAASKADSKAEKTQSKLEEKQAENSNKQETQAQSKAEKTESKTQEKPEKKEKASSKQNESNKQNGSGKEK